MTTIDTQVSREELPVALNDRRAPLWWGMVGIITIEMVVFASLIAAYYYLRYYAPEWPIEHFKPPELLLPITGLVILLVSAAPIRYADRSISTGNRKGMYWGLTGSFILGLAFLVLKGIEYSGLEYQWDTNAYGSIVWTIVGFHSAHVIALLLKTLVVFAMGLTGRFTEERNLGVKVNGLYWYFVVIIWIPLFFTLYIAPRLWGK